MFTDNSCELFTEKLASTDAVPGGGGAAALCGALAVSLCSMAAGLTAGKKKFADKSEELNGIIAKCEALRKSFLRLVDGDAEGFLPLMSACALPAEDESRSEKIRIATLDALRAPFEMATLCCEAIELVERLCDGCCSRLLISDAGCSAALCRSALQCAAMNVFVNTRALPQDPEATEASARLKALLGEYLPRAEKLTSGILALLSED